MDADAVLGESPFLEIAPLAANEMYDDQCPGPAQAHKQSRENS
jgi:hypothetical protein